MKGHGVGDICAFIFDFLSIFLIDSKTVVDKYLIREIVFKVFFTLFFKLLFKSCY